LPSSLPGLAFSVLPAPPAAEIRSARAQTSARREAQSSATSTSHLRTIELRGCALSERYQEGNPGGVAGSDFAGR
jgi:hypothetical protein